jgi:CarD family transcriptional regulator
MPSNKKTGKSQKTPASNAVRGKAGKTAVKCAAPSRAAGRAKATKSGSAKTGAVAKTVSGSVAASMTGAKPSRAEAARSAAKKTAASKSLSVKSAAVSHAESAEKNVAKSAAPRIDAVLAKKTAQAKSEMRVNNASAKSDGVKTGKVGSAKASAIKGADAKTTAKAPPVVATAAPNVNPAASKNSVASQPVAAQEGNNKARTAAPQTSANQAAIKPTAPPIAPGATKALSAAAAAKRPATSEAMASKPLEKTLNKTTGAKVSAPTTSSVAQVTTAPRISAEAKAAPQAAAKAVAAAKPKAANKHGFKLNEHIVYPAHGVGQITAIEVQEVAGFSLELFVVSFIKDKMILKVPTSKVASVGMRKLAETDVVEKALVTLTGRARVKRTMWSRRAQEYEAKINSGDLVTISEVVRDLYRSDSQPEQSYSERQLYEAALDRMAREISAVRKLIDSEALKLIETHLQKGPRRGQKSESDADTGDDGDDGDVEQAA